MDEEVLEIPGQFTRKEDADYLTKQATLSGQTLAGLAANKNAATAPSLYASWLVYS